jgi:large subunit ribosomal protein L32e
MVYSGQSDLMSDLKLRAKLKRKKPDFKRQGEKNVKRLGRKWRSPKGNQSKLRMHKISRGSIPNAGYGSPKSVRNLHPSGFEDVLVHNIMDLEKMDAQKQACRIASSIGKKKKIEIMKKASEMKIKVLNPFAAQTKAEETKK